MKRQSALAPSSLALGGARSAGVPGQERDAGTEMLVGDYSGPIAQSPGQRASAIFTVVRRNRVERVLAHPSVVLARD